MARPARHFVAGQPLHVLQRGNNRQPIFFAEADYALFLHFLAEAARAYGCAVHAYVLMTNHVHLLVTPDRPSSLPGTMQSVGRRYVRHVNATQGRTGTLWEGRYKASVIDGEAYLLHCHRYIEMNPVRAGMVAAPADYPWSSHGANGHGESDPVVTAHALYRDLGSTPEKRRAAYRALFDDAEDTAAVEAIRWCTQRGWALGSKRFQDEVEDATGRPAAPRPRGRPRKSVENRL